MERRKEERLEIDIMMKMLKSSVMRQNVNDINVFQKIKNT